MARTSTTGVSFFANPRSGLSIRGPLDNNRLNGRIANPPRFGMLGGLDVAADRGFKANAFMIAMPGATGNQPINAGKVKSHADDTTVRKSRRSSSKDTDWS